MSFTLPVDVVPGLLAQAADLAIRALRRAVGAGPYHYRSALRDHGREAAGDGSGTGDPNSFGHDWLPVE